MVRFYLFLLFKSLAAVGRMRLAERETKGGEAG